MNRRTSASIQLSMVAAAASQTKLASVQYGAHMIIRKHHACLNTFYVPTNRPVKANIWSLNMTDQFWQEWSISILISSFRMMSALTLYAVRERCKDGTNFGSKLTKLKNAMFMWPKANLTDGWITWINGISRIRTLLTLGATGTSM